MRQLLTRIDDSLHARLKARADREGRSMTTVVTEALERALATPEDQAALLRRRAVDRGVRLLERDTPAPDPARKAALVAEILAGGPTAAELVDADRGPRG